MKIEELESIRGIAAFLIVFFHLPKWNPILDIGLVNNGYLMVELFFVLSGFVIFRAKVEHPFRVLKCQFGFTRVRYKGLVKNTAQLITLFALSNLWMVRKRIIQGAIG